MYVCYYVNNSHFLSLHNVTRSRNVSKFPWLPWAMYTLITFSISVSASDSFVGGAAPSANVAPAMNFPTRAMSDGRERSCKVCTGWAVAARKLHVHNDLILRRNKYYIRLYVRTASGSFLHNLRVFVTPIFQLFVWRSERKVFGCRCFLSTHESTSPQ